MNIDPYIRREILDLVVEANRRCNEVRARLVRGELDLADAAAAYAVATAPLASAARRIAELPEPGVLIR